MIFIKSKIVILIVVLLNIFSSSVCAEDTQVNEIIKVGVYASSPYYEIDANGNVSGYYHDVLTLLQEKYPFKYEYVIYGFSEALTALKEGNIDIMFGVAVTPKRLEDMIYNTQVIVTEKCALYANDEEFNSISKIKKAKVGLVENSTTAWMILNYFKSIGVDVEPVFVSDWRELEKQFEEGKIDIISHSVNLKKEGYYKIYEFSGDQTYIAANKNNRDILDKMDEAITEFQSQETNPMDALYEEYFGDSNEAILKKMSKVSLLLIVALLSFICFSVPKLKRKKIKEKIRFNMRNDNYLLQYQPIYNPRNETVVGFEALLRLQDEDKKLIPPSEFIPEIEENNMLFEVSLWILKTVIKEYSDIKRYDCVKNKEFYISLNISLHEIENRKFIDEASKLLEGSKLGHNKICLEIIERIKVKELDKVAENLSVLKQAGFKIAIDDFGTEYSNLDRLLNLDTHIIKIDKSFVEEVDKDLMKNEIITFVSRIAEVKKKDIVLEGIEKEAEALKIKNMKNDSIYVQGYYYNKPLFKEQIKSIG